jgi:hypothetical protein
VPGNAWPRRSSSLCGGSTVMATIARILVAATLTAVAATFASCGGSPSVGSVTGTFHIMEGGVRYTSVSGVGKITVSHGQRIVSVRKVLSGHRFDLSVPPGSYRVSSTCVRHPTPLTEESTSSRVTVRAGRSTMVSIKCLLDPTVG